MTECSAASEGSTASIFRLETKQRASKMKAASTGLQNFSNLMKEAVLSSETSVNYRVTSCDIAEYSTVHSYAVRTSVPIYLVLRD
jgi:hypothetical protein